MFRGLGYRRGSGRGWDILYNINVWRWGNWVIIKRWSGGRGVYYPHSPPNNLVINITGRGMLYIIRYKTPPPPIYYTYIYKVWISFSGVGGMSFSYTLYIWYEIQLSWNVIQILICSTWNVVKISLTHPHQDNSKTSLRGWGGFNRKGKNFYPHPTKGNEDTGVGEVSD